ncbi:hypothetical protein [Frankia sp. CiP1_Cm_nod2]|uniref:hypothetical protein n=1 Tax=Frankia sp. CiP1_Cm_nod2 TaxID=2897161 RepID=UPI0020240DBD
MTCPGDLTDKQRVYLDALLAIRPETTALTRLVRAFAQLMGPPAEATISTPG